MIIKSMEKSYEVICLYEKNQWMERYLCLEQTGQTECILIRIMDKEWVAATVSYFTGEKEKEKFEEFEACFMSESALCLVFSGCSGIPLVKKMEEEITLKEKLLIFTDILARLTMLDMSFYFAWDCLTAESVHINAALSAAFSHPLSEPLEYGTYHLIHVKQRLGELFWFLFEKELKNKVVPSLNLFEETLKAADSYGNYLDIYEGFYEASKQAEQVDEEKLMKPQTGVFLLWEKITGIFKPLKRVILLLLLLVSLVYLYFTIEWSQDSGEKQHFFESIGTVEIKE